MVTTRQFLTESASARVQRILRSAARGITPIGAVMASPPTVTVRAIGANSSYGRAPATSGGTFTYPNVYPPVAFDAVGGIMETASGNRVRMVYDGTASRRGGHAGGIRFQTREQVVEFCVNMTGLPFMAYVTDLSTGIRARIATDDQGGAIASGVRFIAIDFGSVGQRIIQPCFSEVGGFYGVEVGASGRIWKAPLPDQPRAAVVWDSWGAGILSDTGTLNDRMLTCTDYMMARLGIADYFNTSLGGTGIVTVSGLANFQQRIDNGDLDTSRVGTLDLVFAPQSGNDSGQSDAALYAASLTYYQTLMAKQTSAIIMSTGPQQWVAASAPTQARHDVCQSAFVAAAAGDKRMVWIDTSQSGSFVLDAAINAWAIGSDTYHLTKTVSGSQHVGERLAELGVAGIRASYSL